VKIALQFYGHLRTFQDCFPSIKKFILDRYDCDVFIHTWDTLEHNTKTWHQSADKKKSKASVDKKVISHIQQLYKPKKLKIDSQDFIDEAGFLGLDGPESGISKSGIKYMLYSQLAANELRKEYEQEHNISYDYVIVTRPDIKLLDEFDISKYQHEFTFATNTSIHFVFAVTPHVSNNKFFTLGTMDIFYFSSPNIINIASNCYHHFDKFYKQYPEQVFPNGAGCPELSFHEYLVRNGVVPRFYRTPICIKRHNEAHDIIYAAPLQTIATQKILTFVH
jgi:hypothetical protein